MRPTPLFRALFGFGLRLGLGGALLLGSAGLAAAAALLFYTATYDGAAVRVEWEVNTETDVTAFDLSRQADPQAPFVPLTSLVPTGQRRYLFTDTTAGLTYRNAAESIPSYRLTVRGPGPDQAYVTTVGGAPSAVQRSWATIKMMFR